MQARKKMVNTLLGALRSEMPDALTKNRYRVLLDRPNSGKTSDSDALEMVFGFLVWFVLWLIIKEFTRY